MMRCGFLLLSIAIGPGCGGTTPLPPTGPTSAVGAYHGTWTGQTSHGDRFAFVVDRDRVARIEFNVSYTDGSCTGGLSAGTFGPVGTVITGGIFSATHSTAAGDVSWSIAGTFISTTTASGTLDVTITRRNPPAAPCSPPPIHVTWTAQRS
jgi:hypothetical protein